MNSLPQCGRLGKRRSVTLALSAVASAAIVLSPADGSRAAPVVSQEAVTIRLVADPADANGTIRGAIVLDLQPGWKTYWIDPGEAGLAPSITIDAGAGTDAALYFPAPRRFTEAGIVSIGYAEPVGVGFVAQIGSDRVTADVAIGVCRIVCVPVFASLDLPLRTDGGTDALVDWTFTSLPQEDDDRLSAACSADGSALLVDVDGDEPGSDAEAFAAGPPGWSFGPSARTDERQFSLPILARPKADPANGVRIVFTDGETTLQAASVPVDMGLGCGR